jgi:mono/diheme cytochrome c family protein
VNPSESPVTPSAANTWTPKLVLVILLALITVSAGLVGMYQFGRIDPYVQSVLVRFGNASQGRDIFQMNCAVCHGMGGVGNVGPSLKAVSSRKSRTGLITQVISGKTPPMPQFQPSPQEMADLLSYLENL